MLNMGYFNNQKAKNGSNVKLSGILIRHSMLSLNCDSKEHLIIHYQRLNFNAEQTYEIKPTEKLNTGFTNSY